MSCLLSINGKEKSNFFTIKKFCIDNFSNVSSSCAINLNAFQLVNPFPFFHKDSRAHAFLSLPLLPVLRARDFMVEVASARYEI